MYNQSNQFTILNLLLDYCIGLKYHRKLIFENLRTILKYYQKTVQNENIKYKVVL